MNAIQLAPSPLSPSSSISSNDFLPYSVYEPSTTDLSEWNLAMEARDAEAESSSDFERDRDQLPYSPYDPADEDEYPEDDEDGTAIRTRKPTLKPSVMPGWTMA